MTALWPAARQGLRVGTDIAGAHGQYQVAVVKHAFKTPAEVVKSLYKHGLNGAARAYSACHGAPVGARNWLLAGRVDIQQDKRIGFGQYGRESRPSDPACACNDAAGTRVPRDVPGSRTSPQPALLRLRSGDAHSHRPAGSCRRGLDLAEALEATVDAFEFLEGRHHGVIADLQLIGDGDCGEGSS